MLRSLALLCLACVVGASPADAGALASKLPLRGKEGARPNVLLLTIDTLRKDHLGAYGYRLPTSPAIDRLAAEGVLFTDAITPVPMTAPALASLLTGQHVQHHHVTVNAGTFPDHLASIAQSFEAAGYDTAGFYGNEAVEDLGRGFGVFEEFDRRLVGDQMAMADDLGVAQAIAWLEQAKEPWFLWLHLIDPHGPYNSSPPARSAGFTYPEDPILSKEIEISDKNWVFNAIPRYQGMSDAKSLRDYVRRYDGEIVGSDLQVARLRAWLEQEGELDHTLWILTADHGETLTEDRYFLQHGKVLNESSLHVPLVLRHGSLPSGAKVDAPVSLIDLYPTIARLVGLPAPGGVAGRDVSGALFGESLGERLRVTYTVTPDLHVSVQKGRWRLRGKPLRQKDGGVDVSKFAVLALFDTSTSPETRVRIRDHPKVVKDLKRELVDASLRTRNFRAPEIELSPQQVERLRALGYVD